MPSATNGRNFRGKRGWGEIKRAKRPLSNSSSFIWQHFKCSPFTTSRRDSFHSQGRVLCFFVLPKYIKAIYCNSRRQTSLLVFLPQTRYFSSTLQMSLSDACVHLSFTQSNPPPLSSSSLFEAVKEVRQSEPVWWIIWKTQRARSGLRRCSFSRGWASENRSYKGTCSLSAAPFKSGSQRVETAYVL